MMDLNLPYCKMERHDQFMHLKRTNSVEGDVYFHVNRGPIFDIKIFVRFIITYLVQIDLTIDLENRICSFLQ